LARTGQPYTSDSGSSRRISAGLPAADAPARHQHDVVGVGRCQVEVVQDGEDGEPPASLPARLAQHRFSIPFYFC
jgi:hypothetical protein